MTDDRKKARKKKAREESRRNLRQENRERRIEEKRMLGEKAARYYPHNPSEDPEVRERKITRD